MIMNRYGVSMMKVKRLKQGLAAALLAAVLGISILAAPLAEAASTADLFPSSGTNVIRSGAEASWSNPGNVVADDTNYATVTLDNNQDSNYLYASNFGFSIPTGSTITGITVNINRMGSALHHIRDYRLYMTKDGVNTTGNNLGLTTTDWPTTGLQTATYGGTSNLWGTTWTPAQINSSSFGVLLAVRGTSTNTNLASVWYGNTFLYKNYRCIALYSTGLR